MDLLELFLFLFADGCSHSCRLLVVIPGSVSAGCKHPVIMASVTFRLRSTELSALTDTSIPCRTNSKKVQVLSKYSSKYSLN